LGPPVGPGEEFDGAGEAGEFDGFGEDGEFDGHCEEPGLFGLFSRVFIKTIPTPVRNPFSNHLQFQELSSDGQGYSATSGI